MIQVEHKKVSPRSFIDPAVFDVASVAKNHSQLKDIMNEDFNKITPETDAEREWNALS